MSTRQETRRWQLSHEWQVKVTYLSAIIVFSVFAMVNGNLQREALKEEVIQAVEKACVIAVTTHFEGVQKHD